MELTQEQINNICKNAFLEGLVAGAEFARNYVDEEDVPQLNKKFNQLFSEFVNSEFKFDIVE